MFEILISSKTRRKILKLLMEDHQKEYYLREIAGKILVSPSTVHREVHLLEKEGVLRSNVKGRLKYFTINKSYPLYKTIKSLIAQTPKIPF